MHELIRLKNGLQILLSPREEVKTITAMIFIKAGSRYETKDISGVSHFLEHMFFKGTTKRPTAKAISEEIDSIGGEFNAGTSKEYTVYYVKARAEHLDLSLDVLSDMLLNAKIEAKELEREKGVILEELKMYEDTPMRDIGDVFEQTVWGDQPLGWKTIGTQEAILAMDSAKMIKYKKSLYTRDNIIIGVAGNFEPREVKEKIKQYFAKLPGAKPNTFTKVKGRQQKAKLTYIPKPTEQAHLCIGVRGLQRAHPKRYIQNVMNVILGANMSSRLFINIRERRGLCYYIHSSTSGYADTGTFEVQAGVDLKRVDLAIRAILVELSKLKKKPVSNKELKKAKEYIKGKVALALEDTSDIIQWLGMQQLLEGRIKSIDDIFTRIDAVTAEQIQSLANDLFRDSQINCAIIGPEGFVKPARIRSYLKF